jgi:hypothetical protein
VIGKTGGKRAFVTHVLMVAVSKGSLEEKVRQSILIHVPHGE